MNTKKKTAPEVEDPRYKDTRPGEVVIVLSERTLVQNPALNYGPMMNRAYAVEADEPTILPAWLFEHNSHANRLQRDGLLTVIDATRGVVPPVLDISDVNDRVAWHGGWPEPTLQDRVAHWKNIVIDQSLAWAIAKVERERPDLDPMQIAEWMVSIYDEDHLRQRGSEQRWLAEAMRLCVAPSEEGDS